MPKLSDTRIRAAKPRTKPYKMFDTDGLFLVVNPSGGRWWRQRYRYAGKEQLLSLGTYPEVSLADARERRDALRKQVASGIDPSMQRREQKAALVFEKDNTFKAISAEWMEKILVAKGLTADHIERTRRRFEVHFYPWLGHKAIANVSEDDVMACVRRIEASSTTP
jgi:hypothetical protein